MKKKSFLPEKDKKKANKEKNSHPLNLPTDELRRLSAAMAAQEGARGSDEGHGKGHTSSPAAKSPATPNGIMSSPFAGQAQSNGNLNGISGGVNGDARQDEETPIPPPHRTPMPEKGSVDAEAAKAAGNKFFKAKDFSRAIVEYTKGRLYTSVFST